jgi:hypothetical protein
VTELTTELDGTLPSAVAERLAQNFYLLSALYGTYSPGGFEGPTPATDWRPLALAMLSRGHYALQSVFALEHRRPDSAVMLRVAFEHLVTFAWLLTDPVAHHPMMIRADITHLTELHKDMKKQAEVTLVKELDVSGLEALASKEGPPRFDRRAEAADRYWSEKMPEVNWEFRRVYASLYRPYSALVHPVPTGLMAWMWFDGTAIRFGQPRETKVPGRVLAAATGLLADALFACSDAFGWPPKEQVAIAFTNGINEQGELIDT